MTTQPQSPKKDDKKKEGEQSPVQAAVQVVANLANAVGAVLAGVGRSAVKSVSIKDSATQALRTPLGGAITSTFESTVTVEADPATAKAIAEAQAEAEKAKAEAQLAAAKAKAEAQTAAAEAKPAGQH